MARTTIPLKISAHRHLSSNPFDRLLFPAQGWVEDLETCTVHLREVRCTCQARVLLALPQRHTPPAFEGFEVPDEPGLGVDALMLLRAP